MSNKPTKLENKLPSREQEVRTAAVLGICKVVYADGVTDDRPGIQGLIDGEMVYNLQGKLLKFSEINIASPDHYISAPLKSNMVRRRGKSKASFNGFGLGHQVWI